MSTLKKTVLLAQGSKRQGQIWHAVLTSQQITVLWESIEIDLFATIEQMHRAGLPLPDLLMVGLDSSQFNPYALCHACRQAYPDLKIILTAGEQTEIAAAEQRWAIFQGAQDLLPGIQPTQLIPGVIANLSRVLEILQLKSSLNQEALMAVLATLATTDAVGEHPPSSPQVAPPPVSDLPESAAVDPNSAAQYRGVSRFEDAPAVTPPSPGPQTRRRYRGSSY